MHLNSSLFRSQALMAVIAGSCVIPLVGAVAENLQQVAGNNILTVYTDNPKSLPPRAAASIGAPAKSNFLSVRKGF